VSYSSGSSWWKLGYTSTRVYDIIPAKALKGSSSFTLPPQSITLYFQQRSSLKSPPAARYALPPPFSPAATPPPPPPPLAPPPLPQHHNPSAATVVSPSPHPSRPPHFRPPHFRPSLSLFHLLWRLAARTSMDNADRHFDNHQCSRRRQCAAPFPYYYY